MDDPIVAAGERQSVPEPERKELLGVAEFLERGHPAELLPGPQREKWIRHAEAYVADQGKPPDGRTRVREVWLQNTYRPAFQRFTPLKGKDYSADAEDFG